MVLKTLGPEKASQLDADLMSEAGGFSIDQLMELAGLSVSQAVYKVHPPSKGKNVLVACGPGNNGGDGLVCARHLYHYGYTPTVYYPKPTKKPIFTSLRRQLENLSIPFVDDPLPMLTSHTNTTSTTGDSADTDTSTNKPTLIIDALFGFSFKPPVRQPFDVIVREFERSTIDVLSVDIPSSWDVEGGPPPDGPGSRFMPRYLVSLTAAKPCVKFFVTTTGKDEGKGEEKKRRHFIGGRFVPPGIAGKYGLEIPEYLGVDQVVEVDVEGGGGNVQKL